MKLKDLREKLGKMSGSKLTGQEITVYMRKNPGAKKDANVRKGVEFALDHGGAMTFALKGIEKIKRGLSKHPEVKKALQYANESTIESMKEDLSEGKEEYVMKKGTYTRKVDGKTADKMKKQGWKLVAKEEVEEGTMAIGIKSRSRTEVERAKQHLSKMLKKDGNKKVGSKEGQDFDERLDTYILSDDILADEFANPKNKGMKIIDLLNKHAKRLNVKFESVEYTEEAVLENYRTLARKGMGAETRKSIKVGTVVDYYDNNGNKREGTIIKLGQIGDGYTLKDNKDGKLYKFKYHDRMKAKKLLRAYKEDTAASKSLKKKGAHIGTDEPEQTVHESSAAWAKSLEKIKNQRQLDKISDEDKATLKSIMALLDKEKKRK